MAIFYTIPTSFIKIDNALYNYTLVTCKNSQGEIVNPKLYNRYINMDNTNVIELNNEPITGIKIGTAFIDDYNNAKVNIIDPRGFSIEIDALNTLKILSYYTYNVNTGFEGELLYGWNKSVLSLVPVISEDYKYSISFTNTKKIKLNECIPGHYYTFNNNEPLLFLGNLPVISVAKNKNDYIYTEKNTYVFKTNIYPSYIELSSTKKEIVETNNPITDEELNNEINLFYKSKLNSTPYIKKFKAITQILPNTDKLTQDFTKALGDANTPYKTKILLGSIYSDNITNHSKYEFYLFDKQYQSVTHYFLSVRMEYKGMDERTYCKVNQLPFTDETTQEFNKIASRHVYAYPSSTFSINKNKLIETSLSDTSFESRLIHVTELIEKYKDTDRLYITYKPYLSNSTVFILNTDSGYKFAPIEKNDRYN